MKKLFSLLGRFLSCLLIVCLGYLAWMPPVIAKPLDNSGFPALVAAIQSKLTDETACPEFDQKIDLNNANIVAFTDCRGFYPTLARMIVQNSPYKKVEDVLKIPGLNAQQKGLLRAQMKNFTVSEPQMPLEMRMPPRPMMRK